MNYVRCWLIEKQMQELAMFYKGVIGRQVFHNGWISSWVETCQGLVSLYAYRKEQRSAEIADICSFFPSSLEHCNAMRILSVWATSQTHWGTWGGGVGWWGVRGLLEVGGAQIGEEGKGGGGGKQVHIQPCASGFRTHWRLGTPLSTMTTESSKPVQILNFGYFYIKWIDVEVWFQNENWAFYH